MDITCPYCRQAQLPYLAKPDSFYAGARPKGSGDFVQKATVPICTECNKYWFIRDINFTPSVALCRSLDTPKEKDINIIKTLYCNLCTDEFLEKRVDCNTIHTDYNNLINIIVKIKDERIRIRYSIYIKDNEIDNLLFRLEYFKNEFNNYSFVKLKNKHIQILSARSYLSSIYDCNALIDSKRDSIPFTFENNSRLLKILKNIIHNYYTNLEHRLFKYDESRFAFAFIEQEAFYLCLECILNNFSEIGTTELEEKCKKIYFMKEYNYSMRMFLLPDILFLIR